VNVARAAGLPTGTVTFLFTDLEASTRLWEDHPDEMRRALARHDDILRMSVTGSHGHVVKTTGDGLHAVFATAPDALAAATSAQEQLLDEQWPVAEGLKVRMGLHTGHAEIREGDYYGQAVNRAARVAAAAHGGQVLVSHATEELVRDALTDGVGLLDLGEHRLRDLARAERVFQVTALRLPSSFPPLRSADAFPGNLPAQLSSFVGRDVELGRVADALRANRLVTLTGVGGVGKTRLAVQVAADVVPRYRDGAWLCELAAASDPETMVQVVAASLGVAPRPGQTLEGSVLDFLSAKQLLLVLDNCEHLLLAAGRLAEAILRAAPTVAILATSREGLGIDGEQMRALRSLELPDATSGLDVIESAEAVRLFVERAEAVVDATSFDDGDLRSVAEICTRLDGMPLAIELAAARTVAMAPAEISEHLDERFRLLSGGRRTAVERHHTLRATVDWSYSLLGAQERSVFDRLGAFSGTFDAAAAEAVASGDGVERWDVLDALTDLVAKSMVVAERTSGSTRYTLLETLRHYAREQLDETGSADIVRRRHSQYYAEIAEAIGAGVRTADELEWRARCDRDLDNLRAAVTWSLDRADADDRQFAFRIVTALAPDVYAHAVSGLGSWAERALPYAEDAPGRQRAAILTAAADHARMRGEFDRARRLAEESLRDGLAVAGPAVMATMSTLTTLDALGGDPTRALMRVLEMRPLAVAAGFDASQLAGFRTLAIVWASYVGDRETLRQESEELLRIARRDRIPSVLADGLYAYGHAIQDDDPDGALAAYEESIEWARAGASRAAYPSTVAMAAGMLLDRGERARAVQYLREGVTHTDQVGDLPSLSGLLNRVCRALSECGEPVGAATVIGALTEGAYRPFVFEPDRPDANWDDTVSAVRATLPESALADAMAAGTRMSIEELIAFVTAALDRVLAQLASA